MHALFQAQTRAGLIGEDDITKPDNDFPPRPIRRNRLLSTSLSVKEIEAVIKPDSPLPTFNLVLRRLAALLGMLAILGAGIAVRVLVQLPDNEDPELLEDSLTTALPFNVTNVYDAITDSL